MKKGNFELNSMAALFEGVPEGLIFTTNWVAG
jgi:hypothetical protein